jgi:N-sulfoglucosamine sulfohydrolase
VEKEAIDNRPNILWITTEDMSPHIPAFGDSTVETPHIDRLAKEGIRYTNFYSVYGVCAPSRAAIITGMYPTTIGAMHMRTMKRTAAIDLIDDPELLAIPTYEAVPPPDVRCFTEFLRMEGYYCTNNSKTDYQFAPPITAWDDNSKRGHWRNRPAGKPFFAVFNIDITHESQVWTRKNEPLRVDPAKVPLPPYYPDSPIIRRDIARNYDNIMEMDKQVGELMQQLEEDGLLENTIVFFYSDHGSGLPRSKRWVYDSGIKAPLIIRFPDGRSKGSVDDQLISFIDLAPTMLSLLDVPVPKYMQGQAFLGAQKSPEARKYVYAARDRMDPATETIRAVRDKDFKYIKNYRPDEPWVKFLPYRDQMELMQELLRIGKNNGASLPPSQQWIVAQTKPPEELYDTRVDPYEVNNLAEDPKFAQKLAELRRAHKRWKEETGDLGHIPEPELIKKLWPPHGVQPQTEKPQHELLKRNNKSTSIRLYSATQGASIAYRTDSTDRWKLYSSPIAVQAGSPVFARAIRIGYKESEELFIPHDNIVPGM